MILDSLSSSGTNVTGDDIEDALVEFYRPIVAYIYIVHSLRVKLQRSKPLEVRHDELVGDWGRLSFPSGPLYSNEGMYDLDWASTQSTLQSDREHTTQLPSRSTRRRRHRQQARQLKRSRTGIETNSAIVPIGVTDEGESTNTPEEVIPRCQQPRTLLPRACKIDQAQLEEAINRGDVQLLNHYAYPTKSQAMIHCTWTMMTMATSYV